MQCSAGPEQPGHKATISLQRSPIGLNIIRFADNGQLCWVYDRDKGHLPPSTNLRRPIFSNALKPPAAPNAAVRIGTSVASVPAVVGCWPMPKGVPTVPIACRIELTARPAALSCTLGLWITGVTVVG